MAGLYVIVSQEVVVDRRGPCAVAAVLRRRPEGPYSSAWPDANAPYLIG